MAVEIDQVTKFYGNQKALDQVSFTLQQGGITGFLGPNGAGKSTLMKIITGYLQASTGQVSIYGIPVTVNGLETKRMTGYLPENNPLYTDLYIAEYLEIAARFYKVRPLTSRVREMMMLTGLTREKNKKIGALSKGYRQRVGLAQALIHNPSVLILDEPTSGLDPNQQEEILSLISGISQDKTVLLSSHILREIETVCHRVVIIHEGKLVADSDLKQLGDMRIRSIQQVYVEFDKEVHPDNILKINNIGDVRKDGRGWLLSASGDTDIRPAIFRFAVESQITLLALTERRQNLTDIFQQLTK